MPTPQKEALDPAQLDAITGETTMQNDALEIAQLCQRLIQSASATPTFHDVRVATELEDAVFDMILTGSAREVITADRERKLVELRNESMIMLNPGWRSIERLADEYEAAHPEDPATPAEQRSNLSRLTTMQLTPEVPPRRSDPDDEADPQIMEQIEHSVATLLRERRQVVVQGMPGAAAERAFCITLRTYADFIAGAEREKRFLKFSNGSSISFAG